MGMPWSPCKKSKASEMGTGILLLIPGVYDSVPDSLARYSRPQQLLITHLLCTRYWGYKGEIRQLFQKIRVYQGWHARIVIHWYKNQERNKCRPIINLKPLEQICFGIWNFLILRKGNAALIWLKAHDALCLRQCSISKHWWFFRESVYIHTKCAGDCK